MEGLKRSIKVLSPEKFNGYKTEVKYCIERERLAQRNMVTDEKHLAVYGGLREILG